GRGKAQAGYDSTRSFGGGIYSGTTIGKHCARTEHEWAQLGSLRGLGQDQSDVAEAGGIQNCVDQTACWNYNDRSIPWIGRSAGERKIARRTHRHPAKFRDAMDSCREIQISL